MGHALFDYNRSPYTTTTTTHKDKDLFIPCDYCLQTFYLVQEYECHLASRHDLYPSLCAWCHQIFPPGTRRAVYEAHLRERCILTDRFCASSRSCCPTSCCFRSSCAGSQEAGAAAAVAVPLWIELPVARNMSPSIHNQRTENWLYVEGKYIYFKRDNYLLYMPEDDRKILLDIMGKIPMLLFNGIPETCSSPIVHYSSINVLECQKGAQNTSSVTFNHFSSQQQQQQPQPQGVQIVFQAGDENEMESPILSWGSWSDTSDGYDDDDDDGSLPTFSSTSSLDSLTDIYDL